MIQALPAMSGQPEQLVYRIIVITPNTGRARTGRFGLEIQHLSDETTLPEQPPIKPLASFAQRLFEPRNHRETKKAILGNVLVARQPVRNSTRIDRHEQEQVRRCTGFSVYRLPHELRPHCGLPVVKNSRVAYVRVDAGRQILHAVDEEHEVNVRTPVDRIPRRRYRAQPIEHPEQCVASKGDVWIEGECAAALKDQGAGVWFAGSGFGSGDTGVERSRFIDAVFACAPRITGRGHDFIDDWPLNMIATQAICATEPRAISRCTHQRVGVKSGIANRESRIPADDRDALRFFAFSLAVIRITIEAQERRNLRIRPFREQLHAPSEQRGCEAECTDGVTGVVLTVAKRALAVLPRFTPDD
jgi:hypothetical protein